MHLSMAKATIFIEQMMLWYYYILTLHLHIEIFFFLYASSSNKYNQCPEYIITLFNL